MPDGFVLDAPADHGRLYRPSIASTPFARGFSSVVGTGAGAWAGTQAAAPLAAAFPPAAPFILGGGAILGAGAGNLAARQAQRGVAAMMEQDDPSLRREAFGRSMELAPQDVGQGIFAEVGGRALGFAGRRLFPGLRPTNTIIDEAVSKAVKPSIAGKSTAKQTASYFDKARTAVKTIVDFLPTLKLTDESGQLVSRLPRSLKDMSQAVEQVKFEVFKRYNSLATQAGKQGVRISTTSAAQAANDVVKNPIIQRYYPDISKYAKDWATRLRKAGSHSPEEIQDLIAKMNADLETYYRSPQPGTAARAVIDAGIVNNLRKSLDSMIESATGGQYQLLKNLYGALSTIEKDVSRQAIIYGRKNAKGLVDFSDIFSGHQMVRGITSLDPSTFTSGVAAKLIAGAYKHMNNPNAMVERMFKSVYSSGRPPTIPARMTSFMRRATPVVGKAVAPAASGFLSAVEDE